MDRVIRRKIEQGLISEKDSSSSLAKIMIAEQRIHNMLPQDRDCLPQTGWQYQEPPIRTEPYQPVSFAPLDLKSIKKGMDSSAFIGAVRKLQEALVAQRRALTPEESKHIVQCGQSAGTRLKPHEYAAYNMVIFVEEPGNPIVCWEDSKVGEVVQEILGVSELLSSK